MAKRLWVHHQFSCSVVSDSLKPHGLQHARLSCPSPTPGACANSYSLSRECHPTISSSVVPFSSCLQSFPASGSFPTSQFFTSGDQVLELQLQNEGSSSVDTNCYKFLGQILYRVLEKRDLRLRQNELNSLSLIQNSVLEETNDSKFCMSEHYTS